jgi:hypothetical protein
MCKETRHFIYLLDFIYKNKNTLSVEYVMHLELKNNNSFIFKCKSLFFNSQYFIILLSITSFGDISLALEGHYYI